MRFDRSYVIMALLLFAAACGTLAMSGNRTTAPHKDFASFPLRIGDWNGQRLPDLDAETLSTLGVSDYLNAAYRRGGDEVSLYVGYYRSQRAGESIHSPRNCLPGGGYEVLEARRGELDIPALGRRIPINRYRLQRDQEQLMVLYWFETHGRVIANEYTGKAIMVWESLRTGRSDGALVRVVGTGPRGAEAAEVFARAAFPLLRPYLNE